MAFWYTVNLQAYFARIGWSPDRALAGTTLVDVLAHHMRAIPFENFDVLLGRPPRLDLDSLEAKLVTARRGGYCYEHATLLAAVLRELGLTVAMHSARVVMVTPRHLAPRTHMFLSVGDLVLDPGFGGLAPLVPVPIGGAAGNHRVVRDGDVHALEVEHADGTWQRLWVSTLEHDQPIDFEMANHFTATHPSSPFTQRIMARVFTPEGRIAIMNRDTHTYRGGAPEPGQFADRAALRRFVAAHWGFDLAELERMRVPSVAEWAD